MRNAASRLRESCSYPEKPGGRKRCDKTCMLVCGFGHVALTTTCEAALAAPSHGAARSDSGAVSARWTTRWALQRC